ncbi:response regulator [Rubritalea sp.]|uniref:PAS domain-containing hybrid sensor histidine kinase/response regulator n=1 Tax=Rubritalea sp. TaxID=2109375 RepID=UPI003EF2A94F
MSDEVEKWKKRYEREKNARLQAENLLEEKSSQLFEANEQLEQQVILKSSKLSIEEKKFTALFHSSVDGILLYTLDGVIIDANPTICMILRRSAASLIGCKITDLYAPEFTELADSATEEMDKYGQVRFKVELVRSNGLHIPVEISASKFDVGENTMIQGIFRDITENQKIQKELEEATESAIKANETKSLFLATMSHEIRTPLNGILGFTDILLDSEATEEQIQHLQLIKRSGDILLSIINDILDFSRVESLQIELEMVDYNLTDNIEETLEIHAQTAASKNIDLIYQTNDDVPVDLNGDIGRIKQVILNLVSNALKFTSEGSVIVHASRKDEDFISIDVIDTGIGFALEVKEQLFKPFIQADATTTRKYGGTGLGLSICTQLLKIMGGTISATSIPGKGATFTVNLPIILAKNPVPRMFNQDDLGKLKGLNILVIDDHPINLEYMQIRLTKWDCIVTAVQDSTEASKLDEQVLASFDLIISDMLMPEIDGLTLAKIFKERLAEKRPPMVLATSSRHLSERAEAKSAGYASVIYKPLKERELVTHINAAISGKSDYSQGNSVTNNTVEAKHAFILIVEDNPINAKLAKIIVERMGLVSNIAHNGQEAIVALENNHNYSAILMDMQMPVMDGLVASAKIRGGEAGGHCADIPIIAMTANALAEDKQRCLDAGMDFYVPKPINIKELTKILSDLGIV